MNITIINQHFKPEKCKSIHYNKCDNYDKPDRVQARQYKANSFLSDYSYYFMAPVKLTRVHAFCVN